MEEILKSTWSYITGSFTPTTKSLIKPLIYGLFVISGCFAVLIIIIIKRKRIYQILQSTAFQITLFITIAALSFIYLITLFST
jgi:hypothetical protein